MKALGVFLASLLVITTVNARVLRIGTLPFNPPFEMQADSEHHLYGFDMDVMYSLCKRMKVKCVFKLMAFEKLFTELYEGDIDIAIGGITITDFRQKQYIFSLPYMVSYARFLAMRDSPIQTIAQIRGKVVGVESGTLFKALAQNLYQNNVKVKEFKTVSSLMQAMLDHDVDIILIDNAAAMYWLIQNSDELKLIGRKIKLGIGIGIMSVKKNRPIIDLINKILLNMESDGSYMTIYKRYHQI